MNLREGIPQLSIYEDEQKILRSILSKIHSESRAKALLLIDINGQLLVECGDTAGLDVTSFATLAASNIAATATMAKLVGENDFTLLFHQGKKDSIHISLIGEQVILAVIFGKQASLGLVRLRVRKAANQIETMIKRITQRTKEDDEANPNPLGEITEDDIDNLFSF